MRWKISSAAMAAIGLVGLALSFATSKVQTTPGELRSQASLDPVAQSFERDLNRESVQTASIQRKSIDEDELYQQVNAVHWTVGVHAEKAVDQNQTRSTDEDENSKH